MSNARPLSLLLKQSLKEEKRGMYEMVLHEFWEWLSDRDCRTIFWGQFP